MTPIQEDYILRMVRMMGEVITAAIKIRKTGHLTEADQTLTDALLTIMPDHADLIEIVDAKTVLTLLGNPQLIEAYIELLLERAELKIALDQLGEAEQFQTRALQIFIKSLQRDPKLSPLGQLIWGRLAGLEIHLLLNETEIEDWNNLDQLIQHGAILSP